MERPLIGRVQELERVGVLLDAVTSGPAALLLLGDAGIGKTTIWREAVRRARMRCQVLVCQPSEPESNLSFAGLSDLIHGALGAATLPEPQRRALESALRLGGSAGGRVDKHSVGAGLLTLLRQLSLAGPVVIAVDDSQWLDTPSAHALTFAARRLRDERVGLLLSARTRDSECVRELATEPFGVGFGTVEVGPMASEKIKRIVADRHGQPISRRELDRVASVAGGNPFVALAIADGLKRHGELGPGDLPPIPADIRRLFDGVLNLLSQDARDVLLAAALAARPSVPMVAQVLGLDAREAEILVRDAAKLDAVRVRDREIRFAHPLVAAAVRSRALPNEVRSMHRRLALGALAGSEERAYHLALGAESTDATSSAEIELAAHAAARRGAPETAAELYELAAAITPVSDEHERWERQLLAAEHHHLAGDLRSARRIAEIVAEVSEPECRSRAMLLLAELAWLDHNGPRAITLGEHAIQHATNPEVALEAHTRLAYLCHADRERGLGHANEAVRLLESVPAAGPRTRARALFSIVHNEVDLGRAMRWDLAEEAVELEAADPPPRCSERVQFLFGICLMQLDAIERARPLMEAVLVEAKTYGDDGSLPMIHDQLFQLELLAGRWVEAGDHVTEQLRIASQLGQELERVWALESLALIAAHCGDLHVARMQATIALESAQALGDVASLGYIHRTLGFIALSEGDAGAADSAFCVVDEIAEREGLHSVGGLRHHADHIEAVIELADLDRATRLLTRFSDRAHEQRSPWGAAAVMRCGALLDAAHGDLEAALVTVERALAASQVIPIPFELGRTLMVKGMLDRRKKRKRNAGLALRRAIQIFTTLGASSWAARAERELSRVGVRPAAPSSLTESELQVVRLVRRGLANREIAARLFISEKTVEGVLTRAYRKIGVRGRAELMSMQELPETRQVIG